MRNQKKKELRKRPVRDAENLETSSPVLLGQKELATDQYVLNESERVSLSFVLKDARRVLVAMLIVTVFFGGVAYYGTKSGFLDRASQAVSRAAGFTK